MSTTWPAARAWRVMSWVFMRSIERLSVGSRVVLSNVGAYSIVKAHMFNGINLPSVYSVNTSGDLVLRRRFTYEDFVSRFGACRDAAV